MVVKLSIGASRGLLLLSLAVFCLLAYFSIRSARAAHATGLNTRAGYERAVRLEPGDAHNWYLLGRSYQYDFEQPDPRAALNAFLVSRSLDPHSISTLLDLAANYEEAGNAGEARAAYLEAKRSYPFSADVHWSYGNFLLRQSEIPEALLELRKSLELDPKRSAEAFSRCLRVVPTTSEILDKVIPRDMQAHMDILFDLANSGQMDIAMQVWAHANLLTGNVKLGDIAVLANALLQNNRPADAALLWQQATQKLEKPLPPDMPGSVLWDGGFEASFPYGGLDWHYESLVKGVQIATDPQEKHSGAQSLRLLFAGKTNVAFSDVCHTVIIDPGKSYQLSAWIRTQGLTTDQGLRLVLYSNLKGKMSAVFTPDVHGDEPWTPVSLLWTAPADAHTALVCVARNQSESSDNEIAGLAWVDDVALVPFAAERSIR
jgi:hypothetical protein